jgi:glycosyltransferase involved in cell wall biosynthesis
MHQVSAIIPSFNEAGHIARVLAVLRAVPELQEILVVDDGSLDATCEEVLREQDADDRIRLIRLPENLGKGQAVLRGLQTIGSDLVLMLDADLMDLRPEHVAALMEPVLAERADMTLGLFRGGRLHTDLGHIGTPWLTGQRCLKVELLRLLTEQTAGGYGLETALTVTAQLHAYRVERVTLRGVWHPPAEFHRGLWKAAAWRGKMYAQIWHAWRACGGPTALRLYVEQTLRHFWQDPLRAWHATRKRVLRIRG